MAATGLNPRNRHDTKRGTRSKNNNQTHKRHGTHDWEHVIPADCHDFRSPHHGR